MTVNNCQSREWLSAQFARESSPVIRSKQTASVLRGCFFISVRGSNEFEIHSSRIVVSYRRRKSSALLTPCFVSHRSLKQHSVVLASLTSNPPASVLRGCFFIFISRFPHSDWGREWTRAVVGIYNKWRKSLRLVRDPCRTWRGDLLQACKRYGGWSCIFSRFWCKYSKKYFFMHT